MGKVRHNAADVHGTDTQPSFAVSQNIEAAVSRPAPVFCIMMHDTTYLERGRIRMSAHARDSSRCTHLNGRPSDWSSFKHTSTIELTFLLLLLGRLGE